MRETFLAIDHFSDLSKAQLDSLVAGSRVETYPEDATILSPEESPGFHSFLITGRWWMQRTLQGAGPQEWVDDRTDNWHGGIGPIDKVAPPEVHAETECQLIHVPRDLLGDLASENPHLGVAMLRRVRGGATMLHKHATGEGDD